MGSDMAHRVNSLLPSNRVALGVRRTTTRHIPVQRMVGVLAFGHTRSAEAINIERDLIWILHVKKAPLGKFAGEVWIDLPKLGESGL